MAIVQKPQRPKLPSFTSYVPPPQDSYAGGLIASCRALHSILGGPAVSTSQPQQPVTSDSTRTSPFALKELAPAPCLVAVPGGLRKRKRDVLEDGENEKENIPQSPRDRDQYQTPKRRRQAPLDLPFGLQIADFASINTPVGTTPRRERDEDIEMPPLTVRGDSRKETDRDISRTTVSPIQTRRRRSSARLADSNRPPDRDSDPGLVISQEQWSPLDDRRLVEVVLSKLSLSKREWNDCAKQLGKDKDSLGRRWKLLVGEGNVGLRRGLGRHERGDLDITSW